MQHQNLLSISLVYFLLSLGVGILILLIRTMAIERYQLERRGYAERSALGSLGDNFSNTPSVLFNVVLYAIFFLTVNFFLEYLRRQSFYEQVEVPVFISMAGLALLILVYLIVPVRGKVNRRASSIETEYQTLGYEELIIRKQLADLVRESEGQDYAKAEIARRVIEKLSEKENKTGDAVRRIMTNPESLRKMDGTKPVPKPWTYLKVTYILGFAFAATLTVGTLGKLSGYFSMYDIVVKILPISFVLLIGFTCCLCVESASASEKRRKLRYGI